MSTLWHDYILNRISIDKEDVSESSESFDSLILVILAGFGMSFIIWLTNFFRNRCSYFIVYFGIIVLGATLGSYISFAYNEHSEVYNEHKYDDWYNSIYSIHYKELEQRGCPSKYIENIKYCDLSIRVIPWESELTTFDQNPAP